MLGDRPDASSHVPSSRRILCPRPWSPDFPAERYRVILKSRTAPVTHEVPASFRKVLLKFQKFVFYGLGELTKCQVCALIWSKVTGMMSDVGGVGILDHPVTRKAESVLKGRLDCAVSNFQEIPINLESSNKNI